MNVTLKFHKFDPDDPTTWPPTFQTLICVRDFKGAIDSGDAMLSDYFVARFFVPDAHVQVSRPYWQVCRHRLEYNKRANSGVTIEPMVVTSVVEAVTHYALLPNSEMFEV